MTDISIISAIYGGIQQGLSAAQAVLQMKTSTEISLKVSEVIERLQATQDRVSALHERYAALVTKSDALEKELARFNQFEIAKQGYVQISIGPDALVYMLEKDAANSVASAPKVCARCYQKSEIQFLQFVRYENQFKVLACPGCDKEVKAPHGIKQEIMTAPRRDLGY